MTRILFALSVLSPASSLAATPVAFDWFQYSGHDAVFDQPVPAGHFRNPILNGCFPDPSICRVGDDYYLVNSTFAYFPGIPIFHSRDLVNWEQIGHVVHRPDQLEYDGVRVSHGIFAPAISHHDGTFHLTCTMVDGGGNFVMTAKDAAGPWSDPVFLDFDGIDPSLFFDDDGRAWMVNNGSPPDNQPLYDGHRAIWIQEFDVARSQLIGPRRIIVNGGVDLAKKPVWIEGPHIYRKDDWYYLCCAEGGTSLEHSQVILRSKSVTGPYVPWDKNPILTQRDLDGRAPNAVTCTGHADLFIGPDGNWWSVFLACRPFDGEHWYTGRETFLLPVQWTEDGWPVILPQGERVPYAVKAPVGPALAAAPLPYKQQPHSGNFSWTDGFDATELPPHWFMLRAPKETWWDLDGGKLRLAPRSDRLANKDEQSAFLARRAHHSHFEAATKLGVPAAAGTSAGLVAFQNETHQFYFAVQRTTEGLRASVEKWNGPHPEIVATAPLPADLQHIELRLAVDGAVISFSYAISSGEWQTFVPREDALAISVQAAGGGLHFTGLVVGVHARAER